jgi:hypothetical protein
MNLDLLKCPLCPKKLWHTENGLAAHVWHEHPESKICMGHGRSSIKSGDPTAKSCNGGSVMARCALNIAQNRARLRSTPL